MLELEGRARSAGEKESRTNWDTSESDDVISSRSKHNSDLKQVNIGVPEMLHTVRDWLVEVGKEQNGLIDQDTLPELIDGLGSKISDTEQELQCESLLFTDCQQFRFIANTAGQQSMRN